jgi:hypothetical protein
MVQFWKLGTFNKVISLQNVYSKIKIPPHIDSLTVPRKLYMSGRRIYVIVCFKHIHKCRTTESCKLLSFRNIK